MRPLHKALIWLLPAALSLATAGSAAAGLRPDPPPITKPPPRQAPAPPPVQPQPPPAQPPPTSGDQNAARRNAAAARANAARLQAQRASVARARAAARGRIARERAQRAAGEAAASKTAASRRAATPAALSEPNSKATWALPLVLVMLGAGLLLFGLVLVPPAAVPWPWAARVLGDRREELAFVSAAGLLAMGISVIFVLVSGSG